MLAYLYGYMSASTYVSIRDSMYASMWASIGASTHAKIASVSARGLADCCHVRVLAMFSSIPKAIIIH